MEHLSCRGGSATVSLASERERSGSCMNITGFIDLAKQAPELRFLVIGGYAVGAHGYSRTTHDIDFLVCRDDRDQWVRRLEKAGLTKTAEVSAFAQFSQTHGEPFDLMIVNSATFEQMWTGSEERAFLEMKARIPNLDHLLALKLHALKQQSQHRTFKDADDVETLVKLNGLDISTPHYEQLFLKYGSREIYETFLRICRARSGEL